MRPRRAPKVWAGDSRTRPSPTTSARARSHGRRSRWSSAPASSCARSTAPTPRPSRRSSGHATAGRSRSKSSSCVEFPNRRTCSRPTASTSIRTGICSATNASGATTAPRRRTVSGDERARARTARRLWTAGRSGRLRAGAARRRPRARPGQGHRHRRRHPDQPDRHRAPDGEAAPARRVGGQGEGDGDRLVGGRPLPVEAPRRARARGAAAPARGGSRARGRRLDAARMIETGTGTGWYVYGVVESDRIDEDAFAADPRPLRIVRRGALAAVVGAVDLGEFGEESIVEHLNDPSWLEEKARAHDAVLERVARETTVVPLRVGAVYRRLDDGIEL